uniref:Uncharacterized protein n=1 Tax=Amphora coffeiformis TaxID=265554 RepID=A0A7S3L297_9STRA
MAPLTPTLVRRISIPKGEDMASTNSFVNSQSPPNSPPNSPSTRRSCFHLLELAYPESPLSRECTQFQDVQVELQRRNSDLSVRSSTTPASLNLPPPTPPRAATMMMAPPSPRNQVEPSHADIQRLMMSELSSPW